MCGKNLSPATAPPANPHRPASKALPGSGAGAKEPAAKEPAAEGEKLPFQTVRSEADARLKRWVEIIQSRNDIPGFSHTIKTVMGLMGEDESSLRTLTNIILRDYSLTLAVLRLANSAYYNRSAKQICSITRAVTLMGIDAIKRIAGSVLLLENYDRQSTSLKELLLLSLLTASHSYATAKMIGIRDVEQAYMCGMFRNLGEVLFALYFNEKYVPVLAEMSENGLGATDACKKVAGITYECLGRAAADAWTLPLAINHAMGLPSQAPFTRQSEADKIQTLVAFSHELTHAIYRATPDNIAETLTVLIEKFSTIPNLSRESIQGILDESVTKTKDTFMIAGVPLNDLHLRRQYKLALQGNKHPHESSAATLAAVTDIEFTGPEPGTGVPPPADEALLAQLVGEVRAAVDPASEPKLHEVLMMTLETCHRGAGFERVVFCLATRDRTAVRGRIGLGPSIDQVMEWLRIPLFGQDEPLTLPLLSQKDIFVDAATDFQYRKSKLVARLGASCFGICPVVVDNVVVGCLYFDRLTPGPPPAPNILNTLAQLRDIVAVLIRRTRQTWPAAN